MRALRGRPALDTAPTEDTERLDVGFNQYQLPHSTHLTHVGVAKPGLGG